MMNRTGTSGGNGKNQQGFDPRGAPFLTMASDPNIIRELAYSKKLDDWITLANMLDANMAQNFALVFDKCDRRGLTKQREKYETLLKLLCAVKSQRAWMVQQAIAGVSQAVDFEENRNGKKRRQESTT